MEKIQLNKIKDYKHYYKKYHNLTSKQLVKFRKDDLNMTQSEFAKLMGYYKSYIKQSIMLKVEWQYNLSYIKAS